MFRRSLLREMGGFDRFRTCANPLTRMGRRAYSCRSLDSNVFPRRTNANESSSNETRMVHRQEEDKKEVQATSDRLVEPSKSNETIDLSSMNVASMRPRSNAYDTGDASSNGRIERRTFRFRKEEDGHRFERSPNAFSCDTTAKADVSYERVRDSEPTPFATSGIPRLRFHPFHHLGWWTKKRNVHLGSLPSHLHVLRFLPRARQKEGASESKVRLPSSSPETRSSCRSSFHTTRTGTQDISSFSSIDSLSSSWNETKRDPVRFEGFPDLVHGSVPRIPNGSRAYPSTKGFGRARRVT